MNTMQFHKPTVNHYIKIQNNKMNWLVGEPWRNVVGDEAGLSWFDLSSGTQAKLVKEGDGRQVWRVTVGQETLYAKIFHERSLIDRALNLMGRSRAEREWHTLIQASNRQLPIPEPIALGAARSNRHACVLLTRAIHGAESLSKSWQHLHGDAYKATKRAREHEMIRETATLFAKAHSAGFIHADAHPGNILVSSQVTGPFQVWFVDVLGSKFQTDKLTIMQASKSLAQLDQYFHRIASRTNRLRFLIHYLKERDVHARGSDTDYSAGQLRDFVRAVLSARSTHAHRLAKQWDRRLYRDGKYFGSVRCKGGWRGCVVKKLSRRHVFPEIDIPDRNTSQWHTIIEGLTKQVGVSDLKVTYTTLNSPHNRLIFEWRRPAGIVEHLRWTLFGSPCRHTFFTSHYKRHRDAECPLVLGYLEHRSAGFIDAAAIILPSGMTNS